MKRCLHWIEAKSNVRMIDVACITCDPSAVDRSTTAAAAQHRVHVVLLLMPQQTMRSFLVLFSWLSAATSRASPCLCICAHKPSRQASLCLGLQPANAPSIYCCASVARRIAHAIKRNVLQCRHVFTYACAYVCMHLCMYVCTYVCMYV